MWHFCRILIGVAFLTHTHTHSGASGALHCTVLVRGSLSPKHFDLFACNIRNRRICANSVKRVAQRYNNTLADTACDTEIQILSASQSHSLRVDWCASAAANFVVSATRRGPLKAPHIADISLSWSSGRRFGRRAGLLFILATNFVRLRRAVSFQLHWTRSRNRSKRGHESENAWYPLGFRCVTEMAKEKLCIYLIYCQTSVWATQFIDLFIIVYHINIDLMFATESHKALTG